MAHHEKYGPGRSSPEAGPEPGAEESAESLWQDSAGGREELGDPTTEIAPSTPTPSPREQWFGGFEGAPPPPPPYARDLEDTPPHPSGSGGGSSSSDEEDTGWDERAQEDTPPEGEPWDDTVRSAPEPRKRLQRPVLRTDEEEPDPLAPRRLRRDPDVPEPEQLPPLDPVRLDGSGTFDGNSQEGEAPGTPGTGATTPPVSGPEQPWSARAPFGAEPSEPRAASPVRPEPESGETSDSLNAATLVRNRRQGPSGGWRRAVHTATLGLINPGESAKVLRRRELIGRACTPVASGHHRVAVLSLKGGVGKTTTTVALGATLASLRGDRVLAVDANPDRGTLSDKVRLETAATIRDLLNERHLVSRYADIRGFTSQAPSRLEILASDRDPAVSEAFSDEDYREVARIVEHFYSICITDCGTGLLHSAMSGVLGLADQVVLVSSASVDGARSASATLDWLEAHGHGDLVRGAVVVLSMVRSNSKSSVDLDRLEQHFAGRCREVVRVPWDGHLEEGAEVDLEQLAPATRDAYLALAASVGEAFAR